MSRLQLLALTAAALLLEAIPLAAAHGDEHQNAASNTTQDLNPPQPQVVPSGTPRSYWSLSEHAAVMYWHIALEVLGWVVILPVGVMLSIARSRLALPIQFAFLIVNALALLLGVIYNWRTPELYANNAHSKIGWIVSWVASAWLVMGLIQFYTAPAGLQCSIDHEDHQLINTNVSRYQRVQDWHPESPTRWSQDSGQGTERNSSSLFSHSRSSSVQSTEEQFIGQDNRRSFEDHGGPDDDDDDVDDNNNENAEKRSLLQYTAMDRFLSRNLTRFAVGKTSRILRVLYVFIDRTILVHGFIALVTGTVVYGGIGRGGAVFNVLAHYIKGGIFFGYGLLTLGRWMGAFSDLGWAWNVKPPREVVGRLRAAVPSAEFTESFVIFLYGSINVFLEHLAAWGGAWTAQDLEHVSISVMFFGGGLLGMIVESSTMRDLLNGAILSAQPPSHHNVESWQPPRQYGFSMNPMPSLVILLLGKMMSGHHQSSMLSTMIHAQWGSMFIGFALARGLTYMTLYIAPPTSYLPSRPPTEVITSFCLIAGGITFMVSNKDTVAALESYDLDAMFTFTVTMGLVALVMAWTVLIVAIKGWAGRRSSKSVFTKSSAGVLA